MTRVLALSLYYPPHHFGGYEVSCRDVMVRLAERGDEVTVLTSTLRAPGVEDPADELASTVSVRRELRPYFRDEDLYAPPVPVRWAIERHNQRALARAIEAVRPEVVSVWQLSALSLGLLTVLAERGIPLVYAICDDWLSYGPVLDAWSRLFLDRPHLGRLLRPLLRVPTVLPDVGATGSFCFVSAVTKERSERYGRWRYPDATVVYSGIDPELFPVSDQPVKDRPWTGKLLYVGRYDPRKGIETLVRAVPLLDPGTTITAHGGGSAAEVARLTALADELGVADRVTLGGAVERSELAQLYHRADAFVFPSEWEEPFGLVPLEAMACDLPVLATGVGGSDEFCIDGENCVRFQPGDPAGLAAAVARLADDSPLRRRLIAQGRRTAEFFSVDHLADTFEAWHTAATDHFSGGRPPPRAFELTISE